MKMFPHEKVKHFGRFDGSMIPPLVDFRTFKNLYFYTLTMPKCKYAVEKWLFVRKTCSYGQHSNRSGIYDSLTKIRIKKRHKFLPQIGNNTIFLIFELLKKC